MDRKIIFIVLMLILTLTFNKAEAQRIIVRILDSTYIPSIVKEKSIINEVDWKAELQKVDNDKDRLCFQCIVKENNRKNRVYLTCDNPEFRNYLAAFVFENFEQSFPGKKGISRQLSEAYTFYFLSNAERDVFVRFLEQHPLQFEDISILGPSVSIPASSNLTFNDTYQNVQTYLDYIKFPEAYSFVKEKEKSNQFEIVNVGIQSVKPTAH